MKKPIRTIAWITKELSSLEWAVVNGEAATTMANVMYCKGKRSALRSVLARLEKECGKKENP